jgi:hypothetical protein
MGDTEPLFYLFISISTILTEVQSTIFSLNAETLPNLMKFDFTELPPTGISALIWVL